MKILRKVYERNMNYISFGGDGADLNLGLTDLDFSDIMDSNIIPDWFDFPSTDIISEEKVVPVREFLEDCMSFGIDSATVAVFTNTPAYTKSMGKYNNSDSPSMETPTGSPVRFLFEPISEPIDYDLDQLMGDVYEIGLDVPPEKDCFLPVCSKEEEEAGSSTGSKTDQQISVPDNNNNDLKEPMCSTMNPSELDDYIKNNIQEFIVEDMITDDFCEEVNFNNNNVPEDDDLFATLVSHDTALMEEKDRLTENNTTENTLLSHTTALTKDKDQLTENNNNDTTAENTISEKNQESIVQSNTDSEETKSPATTSLERKNNNPIIRLSASKLQPKVVLRRISQQEIDTALSFHIQRLFDHPTVDKITTVVLSTPSTAPKKRGRPKKITPNNASNSNSSSIIINRSSSSSSSSKSKKRKREESESENNTKDSVQEIKYKNETPMIPTTRTNTRVNPKSEPNRAFGTASEQEKNGHVRRRRCFTVAPAPSSSVESVQEMVDKRFKSREAETPRSSTHRYGLRNRNT